MSDNITDVISYALVRIDENREIAFKEMNDNGFVMVNVDLDADKHPYALFVKDNIVNKQIKEYFFTYSYMLDKSSGMGNKVTKEHPIIWIAEMKTQHPAMKYTLIFYRELYEELPGIDNLRF